MQQRRTAHLAVMHRLAEETMSDPLETYFDTLERASMTRALEKGDERLAGEAAEAREQIREEVARLRHEVEDLRALAEGYRSWIKSAPLI